MADDDLRPLLQQAPAREDDQVAERNPDHPRTRQSLRFMIAASPTGALLARMFSPERRAERRAKKAALLGASRKVTAQSIAQDLFDQGLEQDELFDAMWMWQYNTGIEPSAMYEEYKQLRQHQPTDRWHP